MSIDHILTSTESYYSKKIKTYGATAQGVDWNSSDSQQLRFEQLLRVCNLHQPFTINDYGCGYGALADYLHGMGASFQYYGFDISPNMISHAELLHQDQKDVSFVIEESALPVANYTLASGIFNVKQDNNDKEWREYIYYLLHRMHSLSTDGFAFNVLTSYSDVDRMRPDLFYADPLQLFDYCKKHFSRFVALLHDYPLYEFTLLIRKSG